MREILFRGKRELGNEWIEGSLHTEKFTDDEEYLCCEINQCDVYPETVGQYTGLKDKNGKKIFEGDILRTGTRMGYMLFEKGCFRFRWKNFDKYRPDFFKTCIITEYGSFRELEVIGNIHDNPELLKGGD